MAYVGDGVEDRKAKVRLSTLTFERKKGKDELIEAQQSL